MGLVVHRHFWQLNKKRIDLEYSKRDIPYQNFEKTSPAGMTDTPATK